MQLGISCCSLDLSSRPFTPEFIYHEKRKSQRPKPPGNICSLCTEIRGSGKKMRRVFESTFPTLTTRELVSITNFTCKKMAPVHLCFFLLFHLRGQTSANGCRNEKQPGGDGTRSMHMPTARNQKRKLKSPKQLLRRQRTMIPALPSTQQRMPTFGPTRALHPSTIG